MVCVQCIVINCIYNRKRAFEANTVVCGQWSADMYSIRNKQVFVKIGDYERLIQSGQFVQLVALNATFAIIYSNKNEKENLI